MATMTIKDIIIVGGGSAGWMTAATLIHQFPDKQITLIESPTTPTVGVGDSTLSFIKGWMHLLEINEDFMKECDATYKMSIRFEDFYKKNYGHFHYPFGIPHLEGNNQLLNEWYLANIYKKLPLSDYADSIYPGMSLVNNKRIFKNEDNSLEGFNFKKDVAYHMDATKFGLWLKNSYCIPKGVKYISEDIKDINLDENGIESLNSKYKADLFIDCTGFKSLLLSKHLKEPFDSYEDIIPNNSAWATKQPYVNKEQEINAFTNCKAVENGWIWNIPLWSRMGTGYVYSDKFISDEDALKQFQKHIGSSELDFKNIKMKIGLHKRVWVKNVCAIGLSAGFIEPLESNGLFTVHEFLIKLVRTLKRGHTSQWDKDVFNAACKSMFREFAEFVSMHYAFSHREDTPYWKAISQTVFCQDLIDQKPQFINGFVLAAYNKIRDFQFSSQTGLHYVATGLNYFPTDVTSIVSETKRTPEECKELGKKSYEHLKSKKERWEKVALKQPTLFDTLKDIHEN